MKKRICTLVLSALVLLVSGCSVPFDEGAKQPPTRLGKSTVEASLEKEYSFDTAMEESDAVARVMVGNWLGEDCELQKTYYEAAVLQCFKGDIPEKITLLQDGCSLAVLKGYPLFMSGNELLVFLNQAVETDYPAPYWIIGSFTTLLDVSYDSSGTRYYADRYGLLGATIGVRHNYASQRELCAEIYTKSVEADPIVREMQYTYPYLFSEDELLPLLESR